MINVIFYLLMPMSIMFIIMYRYINFRIRTNPYTTPDKRINNKYKDANAPFRVSEHIMKNMTPRVLFNE